jgi:hypothetical protein
MSDLVRFDHVARFVRLFLVRLTEYRQLAHQHHYVWPCYCYCHIVEVTPFHNRGFGCIVLVVWCVHAFLTDKWSYRKLKQGTDNSTDKNGNDASVNKFHTDEARYHAVKLKTIWLADDISWWGVVLIRVILGLRRFGQRRFKALASFWLSSLLYRPVGTYIAAISYVVTWKSTQNDFVAIFATHAIPYAAFRITRKNANETRCADERHVFPVFFQYFVKYFLRNILRCIFSRNVILRYDVQTYVYTNICIYSDFQRKCRIGVQLLSTILIICAIINNKG